MRSSLEHFEFEPEQGRLFGIESENMKFESLKACIDVGRAFFTDDQHKIVRSYVGAYKALVLEKGKRWLLGVSTKRAVYVRLEK